MIRSGILALSLMIFGASGVVLLSATPASAAASCDGRILTIPPWHCNLERDASGGIVVPADSGDGEQLSKFVWSIGANIADAILQIAAYAAVGFVIYGGFVFMTSAGAPERAAAGRKTLTSALVSLVIAASAVLLVNLVARTALGI